MRERKTAKWSGWLVATGSLILAGLIAISGAPRAESPSPAKAPSDTHVTVADTNAHSAQADTDVLDLQLD